MERTRERGGATKTKQVSWEMEYDVRDAAGGRKRKKENKKNENETKVGPTSHRERGITGKE